MLTEPFINLCCQILVSNNSKISNRVISDISHIFNFYAEGSIPVIFKQKYDLVKVICKLRLIEKKTIDQTIDNIITVNHFKDLHSFIHSLNKKELSDQQITEYAVQIKERKKFVTIFKDIPEIEKLLDQFNTNAFTNSSEFIKQFEKVSHKIHTRISEEKRNEENVKVKNLNLKSDSYENVLSQMYSNYHSENSVSTGYTLLDRYLQGGFQSSRIYVFCGASGDGKSTLLCNFAINACEQKQKQKIDDKDDIYVYITLENFVDETLLRIYCNKVNLEANKVLDNFSTEKEKIKTELTSWQEKNKSMLIVSYFQPCATTVSDIVSYIDEIRTQYKDTGRVRAVYVDYLDLLKTGQIFDLYRLEMGQITLELKAASTILKLPIISVTQSNRSAYDAKQNLSLTQVGESIKKVEHSDFIAMIRALPIEDEQGNITSEQYKMQIQIGKNRNGPKNKVLYLMADFSKFKIEDIDKEIAIPFHSENILPEDLTI